MHFVGAPCVTVVDSTVACITALLSFSLPLCLYHPSFPVAQGLTPCYMITLKPYSHPSAEHMCLHLICNKMWPACYVVSGLLCMWVVIKVPRVQPAGSKRSKYLSALPAAICFILSERRGLLWRATGSLSQIETWLNSASLSARTHICVVYVQTHTHIHTCTCIRTYS